MSRVNRSLLETLLSAMLLTVGSGHLAADERANSPAEVSFHGGGWDLNGPAMSGTKAPAPAASDVDAPKSDLPHRRRGGWDGNGSALVGTAARGTDELDLDGLTIESVTPPNN
jgi:hypothetical protein